MIIYTYQFSRSLAESLGISFTEIPELSDQMIDLHQPDDHFANYATRGGGAAGSKNGHYGCKHTEETKEHLRQIRLGKSPSNKGIPNPKQSERWKKNNPMFNMDARERMRQSKIGKEPSNKIKRTVEFACKWCGEKNTRPDTKKSQRSFCNKSCAASYSNTYRYISQPPAAEQASS